MKQSTLAIIDDAMEFNVEVQEDNLHLQEMKNHLLQLDREDKDNQTRSSFESVETNSTAVNNQISLEVLGMIDSSIADLDKQINYPHFLEVQNKSAIMYNYSTIWNMATCFREMLGSLAQLGSLDLSYEEFRSAYLNKNEMNIMLTDTHISDSDYVTMNIPQPRMQSTSDAGMTKDHLNESGKYLNYVADASILEGLAKTKYEISAKLASNRPDAIKSAHFIAQIIMAIKNSLLLMKNYHSATLNELQ